MFKLVFKSKFLWFVEAPVGVLCMINHFQFCNLSYLIMVVTTPNINSQLALPYQKPPVNSSTDFKVEWMNKKEYVRKASSKDGMYYENKERRRSEPFPWPGGGRFKCFMFMINFAGIKKISKIL